jgi:hypothetical protein
MLAGKRKAWTIAGVALALAIVGGGAGAVVATGGDSDQPITGQALDRASKAALDHTGGGRVTETEAGDEDSYYEVEVTLDDGSQVDVQLDEGFNVVGQEADNDGAGDQDGANDN